MTTFQGVQIAALGLHIVAAAILIGGWFGGYVCLRSTAGGYEESSSLRLSRRLMQKFFPWVWVSFLVLVVSGYAMLFWGFGSFAATPFYINLDQAIGWVMIALFVWLFFVPWREFNYDIDAQNWSAAAANLKRIHKIILVSLLLGVISLVAGGTGHLWG